MAWQFPVVAAVVRYLRSCRGSEWHGSLSAVPRSLVFHLGDADAGLLELEEYWSPEHA